MTRIAIEEGDLTRAEVDAVVNAANTELALGTGVAGAIRERGGPSIQRECSAHGPISLGEAAITGAGELPARHVIHAAAMQPGARPSEASIRSATRRALELAAEHGLRSVALPAIGTGVGGFPMQRCAEVMLEEAQVFVERDPTLDEIRFVLLGEPAYRLFEQVRDAAKIRLQLERMRR